MGDAYLALKLGDRIGTEGVVEEGWAIGQLYELNGSMRSQGWYPPAYASQKQKVCTQLGWTRENVESFLFHGTDNTDSVLQLSESNPGRSANDLWWGELK